MPGFSSITFIMASLQNNSLKPTITQVTEFAVKKQIPRRAMAA
jgi:hypothetical protein